MRFFMDYALKTFGNYHKIIYKKGNFI